MTLSRVLDHVAWEVFILTIRHIASVFQEVLAYIFEAGEIRDTRSLENSLEVLIDIARSAVKVVMAELDAVSLFVIGKVDGSFHLRYLLGSHIERGKTALQGRRDKLVLLQILVLSGEAVHNEHRGRIDSGEGAHFSLGIEDILHETVALNLESEGRSRGSLDDLEVVMLVCASEDHEVGDSIVAGCLEVVLHPDLLRIVQLHPSVRVHNLPCVLQQLPDRRLHLLTVDDERMGHFVRRVYLVGSCLLPFRSLLRHVYKILLLDSMTILI